jgi:hypothetical protein
MRAEYNSAIRELLEVEALDFLLVFKGMLLQPETLQAFNDRGIPCYCLYPDVSFHDHGDDIWNCIPIYDGVFTTKSFHVTDDSILKRTRRLQLVRHGFDADVHRHIVADDRLGAVYGADVSFVGLWSKKKEAALSYLIHALPGLELKIWGPAWERASEDVQACWQGRGAYGDETAAIYSLSKINLGLLSEAGRGTTAGDRTTARTWQIPASKGFMLHEETEELASFFELESEVAVFRDLRDLAEKVTHYLNDATGRRAIAQAGYIRCIEEPYTYANAVSDLLAFHAKQARR